MSKRPTGLTISRDGGTYIASWKCGDKNYNKGQQFQYKINDWGWASLSISKDARSKAVYIDLGAWYPNVWAFLWSVSIRVRGKVDKKGSTWSEWTTATYTNYAPNVSSLDVTRDEQSTNVSTFNWSLETATTDAQPYWNSLWESMLVKESDVTNGEWLAWNASAVGWDRGTGGATGSIVKTEDTTLLANASYTRWFRIRARGANGEPAWSYARHVYARPYQAVIEHAEISAAGVEGLTCYARWTADQTPSHPIDRTTVQYVITVPNTDLSCPSGAQWTDANVSADTSNTDAVRFSIDDRLDKDECLFVRVNTVHDTNVTYGSPALAAVGSLADPTDLGYQVDNTDYTLTSVSVDNNSSVPDAFIALVYRPGSKPEDEVVVGIIPHGASQPLVLPVQCPDWSQETEFSIGAFAAVGSYEANSVGYTVTARMRSENTIWVGGAVPVAPENINLVQSPITGTATVTWDWTWAKATRAQLSWTDHEDAWESTDEPDIYTIPRPRATKWNISGLELGKKWFIAVRLVSGNPEDENAIYSPWSDLRDITLSSVPNVPTLNLSAKVITEGEEITASWDYVSNDGTGQVSAEIKDENGTLIAHTEMQKEIVIDTEALGWAQGEAHSLSVRVTSESGRTTEWSNPVSIVIAEALECSIAETSLETKTIEVNPRPFEKTDFLSFLTEQEEVFTKLQVDLGPIQDLHGYDSPWVGGGGVNKWKPFDGTSRGITFTPQDDGTVKISGTMTSSGWPQVTKGYTLAELGLSVGDTLYCFVPSDSDVSAAIRFFDSDSTQLSQISANSSGTIPANTVTVRLLQIGKGGNNAPQQGDTINAVGKFEFLKGSSAPTSWTPYENICPISGWNSVGVVDCGVNIFDGVLESGTINSTTGVEESSSSVKRSTHYFVVGSQVTYFSYASGTVGVRCYDKNKAYIGNVPASTNSTFTTLANTRFVRFVMSNGVANNPVSINYPSTDTTYHTYNGNTYTTSLGTTVYGGTLDLVSGELTVDRAIYDLSSFTWTFDSVRKRWVSNVDNTLKKNNGGNSLVGAIAPNFVERTPNQIYNDNTLLGFAITATSNITYRNGDEVNSPTGTIVAYLATPQTYQLTSQQIQTLLGQNNVWSEDGEITARIAETYKNVLSLTQMPLTVELAGVNNNIISTLTIERTADYHMDRPDETQFDGFKGEIVYLTAQNGGEDIIINQEDLIGLMDDEAPYRVFVTFKDVYGQSMSDSVDFEVHWEHQAIIPEAEVVIDNENLIAKLTPIAPTGALTGDTCDIYRLSADRPELIVKDAVFGTQYVDPYPAIGEFGGHRFVFKTVNGDYITATNDIAWTDTGIEEGDILESERAIIDFDGNQLLLYYNVDVGHQWDKDFQQTKYLGGSVQGDWNAGVSRSGSVSATMITLTDAEQIRMMRDLAVYTGVCHVRTTDGSSYTADVQVSEDRDHDDYGKLASFSLTITRIDAETLDGLTYQQWAEEEE